MDLLPCGHVAAAGPSRLCAHLLGPEGGNYIGLLTGRALAHDLCCPACDRAAAGGHPPELLLACDGCVARCCDDESALVAWRGEPGIVTRPEPLDPGVAEVPLPVVTADLVPVTAGTGSVWLLLGADGQIGRFDAGTRTWDLLARATVPDEPGRRPWAGHRLSRRLHACPSGRFAAVVHDYGRYGQVIDLQAGAVTLTLDGGTYHPETVPFSLAFTWYQGRVVVIHRTGWNRLDISDAATGELLTGREAASAGPRERPGHYLDYFHGALSVSPGGRWIADDGWVWAPVGVPCVWDLHRWLAVDVWESEDGPTRRGLCQRAYYWDTPMCWTGENLLAISGIGGDQEAMLAGVRIFDVTTGSQAAVFAGPAGRLFAAGPHLFAAALDGLQVWDTATGELTGTIPGFVPARHHVAAGELAAFSASRLDRWSTPR